MGDPSLLWIIQPQISPPTLSASMSAPVKIATTPGVLAAADVSIFLIVAWACGERRK